MTTGASNPIVNSFFLQRYMLHTDWHFGSHVRAFVQLKSGLESFREGGPRPIDEKKLDFHSAFVEIGAGEGDRWVVLQAGRQELNYGSGRLVSVREGPNVRQSFDGAKLKIKAGAWRVDAFAARPDLESPVSSITSPITAPPSGAYTRRVLGSAGFRLMATTSGWTEILYVQSRHGAGDPSHGCSTSVACGRDEGV